MGTILKMNNVYKNVQSVQTQKPPITQPNKNENACFYLPITLQSYTPFSLVSLCFALLSTPYKTP